MLRMSYNTLGKYVQHSERELTQNPSGKNLMTLQEQFETEEMSDRSPSPIDHCRNKAKEVLRNQGVTSGFVHQLESTKNEELEETPEASKFHIIPENSMEVSNSNFNSNQMEGTRQQDSRDDEGCTI